MIRENCILEIFENANPQKLYVSNIWCYAVSELLYCLHSVPQAGHDGTVTSLCWGGRGTLFSGSEDKHVTEWNEKGQDYAQ